METSLYDYVLAELDASPLTYQEIADGSGVNKRTVEKIARKEIDDPGVSHIDKLAAFFRGSGRAASTSRASPSSPRQAMPK